MWVKVCSVYPKESLTKPPVCSFVNRKFVNRKWWSYLDLNRGAKELPSLGKKKGKKQTDGLISISILLFKTVLKYTHEQEQLPNIPRALSGEWRWSPKDWKSPSTPRWAKICPEIPLWAHQPQMRKQEQERPIGCTLALPRSRTLSNPELNWEVLSCAEQRGICASQTNRAWSTASSLSVLTSTATHLSLHSSLSASQSLGQRTDVEYW